MRKPRSLALAGTLLAAGLFAFGLGTTSVAADAARLSAALTGPGDGSGEAVVELDSDLGTVCWELAVRLAPPATAAHIHRGAAGENGPVVVPFDTPVDGVSVGCASNVDPALIREIIQNAAGFYVNVHNSAFPGGAIRGQLGQ
jgi:hypothetical protein